MENYVGWKKEKWMTRKLWTQGSINASVSFKIKFVSLSIIFQVEVRYEKKQFLILWFVQAE